MKKDANELIVLNGLCVCIHKCFSVSNIRNKHVFVNKTFLFKRLRLLGQLVTTLVEFRQKMSMSHVLQKLDCFVANTS